MRKIGLILLALNIFISCASTTRKPSSEEKRSKKNIEEKVINILNPGAES